MGVSIASLTHGAPAHKSNKIFIRDKILEVLNNVMLVEFLTF